MKACYQMFSKCSYRIETRKNILNMWYRILAYLRYVFSPCGTIITILMLSCCCLFAFGFLLGFTELGMSVFTGVIASACVSICIEVSNNIKWHRRRYKVINGLTSALYQHLGRVYGTHLDYISETIEDLYFLYPEVLFVLNSGVEYLYSEELEAIKRIVGYVKTVNANIHRGITKSNDFEQTPNYILNGELMSFLSSHGINVNYQNYVDPIKEVEKDPNWVLSNNLSTYVDHISKEILTLVRYGMKELDSGISLATEKKGVYKSIIANRKKFREQRKKSFMGYGFDYGLVSWF